MPPTPKKPSSGSPSGKRRPEPTGPVKTFKAKGIHWPSLIGSLAVSHLAGIGGFFTQDDIEGWYRLLAKPVWTPPDMVFPIVWPVLYTLIGISLYRAGRGRWRDRTRRGLFFLFGLQWLLNLLWTPVFFELRNPEAALSVIVPLVLFAGLAAVAFRIADRVSTWLWAPYVGWLGFATALNIAVAAMN